MPETWWEYVARITDDATQKDIAARAGVDASRLTGWKNGGAVSAQNAVAFARAYRRPPVEGLVAAGYLAPNEVNETVEVRASARDLSNDALIEEVRRRVTRRVTPVRASRGTKAGASELDDDFDFQEDEP